MQRLSRKVLMILTGLGFVLFAGGMATLYSQTEGQASRSDPIRLPIVVAHQGSAPSLDRPPVEFDHDRHTAALSQAKAGDCAVCHVVKEADPRLASGSAKIFKFPKRVFDETDKTSTMYAYHNECVSCHRKVATEGKKTGPDIGLCGKCHVKRPGMRPVAWAWSPIFNYLRHSKHVQVAKKWTPADKLNVAENVEVIGEATKDNCETCHHTYDETKKKLVFKKDSENSCQACHKGQDDKNARSMKKVAHAACIGCHMKLAKKVKLEAIAQGRKQLTEQEKTSFGPFECKGCHGEHKQLTPEEIAKVPRLVRGQKDVIDLTLQPVAEMPAQEVQVISGADATSSRMKAVPYNHKAHEPRGQFCSTCHHHSLEKCSSCHTKRGDNVKGGGVSYERAFHKATAQQACVGCHDTAKQDMKCQGCHKVSHADAPKSSCQICHRGPSGGKPLDVAPAPLVSDKDRVPEKLMIKLLEKEFKPADFPHQKIIAKLTKISNENSLARVFHSGIGDQALCSGCHHKTDPAAAQAKNVPTCSTCHSRPFDPNELGKPGILGAYHRQCVGCHQAMKQKPAALECSKCHAEKEALKTAAAKMPGTVKGH